ncbi:uncharacterized protein [Procambarus clarkii]|uniref:uncharacterized protein isoform X4 n=1 Tax=Procambarus clarkii TaxID=6728 RepID=UPI003743B163
MKPTLKCCGRSWQQSCRKILSDLQMWFGKSRSSSQLEELIKQNQVKVIMMHGLAWSESPLLCKRKSANVIVTGVVLAFWIFCSSRSICPTT